MRSSSEAQSKAWLPDQDFPPPLRYGGSAFGGEPGQTPLRLATAGATAWQTYPESNVRLVLPEKFATCTPEVGHLYTRPTDTLLIILMSGETCFAPLRCLHIASRNPRPVYG